TSKIDYKTFHRSVVLKTPPPGVFFLWLQKSLSPLPSRERTGNSDTRTLSRSCSRAQALSLALSPGGRGNCPCHIGYTEAAANTFISEVRRPARRAIRSPLALGGPRKQRGRA